MAKTANTPEPTNPIAKRETKASQVERLLKARNGATIADLGSGPVKLLA